MAPLRFYLFRSALFLYQAIALAARLDQCKQLR